MNYRSAESARLVGIGLVSIVAIAIAASTIQSVTTAGGASVAGPGVELPGGTTPEINLPTTDGPGGFPEVGGPDVNFVASLQGCVQPLAAWYGGLVYFGAFAGVLYLFKRAYSTGAAVLGAYAVAPVAFLGYFLMTSCASAGGPGTGPGGPVGPPGPPNSPFLGLEMPLMVAGGVFADASLDVGGVARVERPVPTAQYVHAVGGRPLVGHRAIRTSLRFGGALPGDLGDTGVGRTARTGVDATRFVAEDARELVGDVRATVVTGWHWFLSGMIP